MVNNYQCFICGNSFFSYLYKGVDRCYDVKGEFDIYRCNTCGLIFIFPAPKEETLKKYYPDDYYSYAGADNIEVVKRTPFQKMVFYLKHPLRGLNCIVYSKLLKQKDTLGYKKGLNVLDIGCGDGKYLIDRRRDGCDCFGVDINPETLDKLKKKSRDVKTYCGNVWDAGLAAESFDVINLNNVLEHLVEPERFLMEARRIMKKEAVIRIVVPNSASLTYSLFHKYWMGLEVPRHVNTYSLRNLKILFKKAGFNTRRYRTIENSYDVICSIIYLLNAVLKKNWRITKCSSVWDNELLKLLFFPYALFVNAIVVGDTAEFILQKGDKSA